MTSRRRTGTRSSRRTGGVFALALVASWACDEPSSDGSSSSGDRFTRAKDGIVREVSIGLEWTDRDNGAEVNWHTAEKYCRELARAGRSDWRLPSVDELTALFDAEGSSRCGDVTCQLAAPIELTSPYQWTASPEDSDRRFYVDFRFGTRLAPRLRPNLTRRALCVRSERAAN